MLARIVEASVGRAGAFRGYTVFDGNIVLVVLGVGSRWSEIL